MSYIKDRKQSVFAAQQTHLQITQYLKTIISQLSSLYSPVSRFVRFSFVFLKDVLIILD